MKHTDKEYDSEDSSDSELEDSNEPWSRAEVDIAAERIVEAIKKSNIYVSLPKSTFLAKIKPFCVTVRTVNPEELINELILSKIIAISKDNEGVTYFPERAPRILAMEEQPSNEDVETLRAEKRFAKWLKDSKPEDRPATFKGFAWGLQPLLSYTIDITETAVIELLLERQYISIEAPVTPATEEIVALHKNKIAPGRACWKIALGLLLVILMLLPSILQEVNTLSRASAMRKQYSQ